MPYFRSVPDAGGQNGPVMELRQIESFVRVADELHFARAAASLGLAPSVVSDHIRRLEQEVGHQLFDRSRRAVALTAAGETFRPYAERVLASVTDAALAMRDMDADGHATVRVATGTGLGSRLWAVGRRARSARPPVLLRFTRMPLAERLRAVTDGAADVAIVRGEPEELTGRDLDLTWLWDEALVAVLQSSSPMAASDKVDLRDLRDLPLSIGGGRSPLVASIVSACRAAGFTPMLTPGAPESGIEESLAAFALGPASWTVFYAPHADQLEMPGVSFVPFADPPTVPTFGVTAGERRISPPTAAFLQLCRALPAG